MHLTGLLVLAIAFTWLTGCSNALYFYETDKISMSIEGRPDSSQPVQGSLGLKQRVAVVAPPKDPDTMTKARSDAVSMISTFRFRKDKGGFFDLGPVTIQTALVTKPKKVRSGGERMNFPELRPEDNLAALEAFYSKHTLGATGAPTAAWESENLTVFTPPYPLTLTFAPEAKNVRVRCHKKVAGRVKRVGWGEERTPTHRRARFVGVPSSPQPTSYEFNGVRCILDSARHCAHPDEGLFADTSSIDD